MNLPSFRSEQRAITALTRKSLLDLFRAGISYHGELSEIDFLGRLYDLEEMPSTDRRYRSASGDIYQHTVNNHDWEQNWVFTDARFQLSGGPDEVLLGFLAETVHPLVRPFEEADALVEQFNKHLRMDGWQICPTSEMSGRAIYGYLPFSSEGALIFGPARDISHRLNSAYLGQQVTRLQSSIVSDPELAIGTAKEFLESVTKTLLKAKGLTWTSSESFPQLVKKLIKALPIVPEGLDRSSDTQAALTVIVNNIGSIVDKLAEVRNWHGTGHGKPTDLETSLLQHQARFSVGISVQVAHFLFECYSAENKLSPVVLEADAEADYDPFEEL
ncbi:MAG: abortive infection family protein [Armatimonadetes bacterium]|nr:abortive infection family protein [Armatimonadota bacterium]